MGAETKKLEKQISELQARREQVASEAATAHRELGCWGVTEQKTRFRTLELVSSNTLFRGLVSREGSRASQNLELLRTSVDEQICRPFPFAKVCRKIHYFCEVFCESRSSAPARVKKAIKPLA